MQVEVLNIQGATTGRTIELPDEIFAVEPNDHVLYLAVKQYQAAQRQGTHKVKTRAEVQGASRNCTNKKVPVVRVRVTFVTLCIKAVVPFSDLSHTATALS